MKQAFLMPLSLLTVFTLLSGCAATPNSDSAAPPGSEALFFGQITAIDGSDIVIAVGEQPKLPQLSEKQRGADATASATTGNDDQMSKPQGGTPSGDTSLGDDNAPNGNIPNGSTSQGDDNAPNGTGKSPGGLTLTGEEKTITVSDGTVITIQAGKDSKTGSLADLKTGDIVAVALKTGKVTGLTVMQLNNPPGADGPGPQSSETAADNAA